MSAILVRWMPVLLDGKTRTSPTAAAAVVVDADDDDSMMEDVLS